MKHRHAQSRGGKRTGHAPRDQVVDDAPTIFQHPAEGQGIQAHPLKGGLEGLPRQDDGEVLLTDEEVDADPG